MYIEKNDVSKEFKELLKNEYSQVYDENNLPMILVVIDGKISEVIYVLNDSFAESIIDYEVFK